MKIEPIESFAYKWKAFLGKTILRIVELFIDAVIVRKPVYQCSDFSWIQAIEKNHSEILREYIEIKGNSKLSDINQISDEQKSVVEKDKWFFFPLYAYGIPIQKNLELCPVTAQTIKHITNVTTVFFSVLTANTYVKPHRGAFKGYLRYHLGVQIPNDFDCCGIRIRNKIYHWENGKSLIFDDTYIHDAWNESSEDRVVLYVDFVRPMPKALTLITKSLTKAISKSPFVQNALEKYEREETYKSLFEALN
jgi:beta-hydroxylase